MILILSHTIRIIYLLYFLELLYIFRHAYMTYHIFLF